MLGISDPFIQSMHGQRSHLQSLELVSYDASESVANKTFFGFFHHASDEEIDVIDACVSFFQSFNVLEN